MLANILSASSRRRWRSSLVVNAGIAAPNVRAVRKIGQIFAVAARWAGRIEPAPTTADE
jgi:hypothetical protein